MLVKARLWDRVERPMAQEDAVVGLIQREGGAPRVLVTSWPSASMLRTKEAATRARLGAPRAAHEACLQHQNWLFLLRPSGPGCRSLQGAPTPKSTSIPHFVGAHRICASIPGSEPPARLFATPESNRLDRTVPARSDPRSGITRAPQKKLHAVRSEKSF